MPGPDFAAQPLWLNLLVFAAAAGVVWYAGARLSGYATAIAERTGLGKAFVGLLLLGGITSLPEVAVVTSSAYFGDPVLGVNNLLGSVSTNLAILALADAVMRRAVSAVVAAPAVLLQGTFDILFLVLVAFGIAVGGPMVLGVGVWSLAVLLLYVLAVRLVLLYQRRPTWSARDGATGTEARWEPRAVTEAEPGAAAGAEGPASRSLGRVYASTALAALAILLAGFLLSRTGDAIAQQTGLGQSFVGVALLAFATSLPEVSTVVAAVRLGQLELAFSDVFGTNVFNVALIFVVDLVYVGPSALGEAGTFSLIAALLGIGLTTIYLAGLIERRDRTLLRMGPDSLLVLALYAGGLCLLYTLR